MNPKMPSIPTFENSINIFHFFKHVYIDRGMKKWSGFVLAEHAAHQEAVSAKIKHVNHEKTTMSLESISQTLKQGYDTGQPILIQLNELTNSHYAADIQGVVKGFYDHYIFISRDEGILTLEIDQIKHIQMTHAHSL